MKKGSETEKYYKIAERYYAKTTVDDTVPMPVIRKKNGANGIYIWDGDSKMYIDLTSGVGVANIGYNQKLFNDTVAKWLKESGYANFLHHDWHNANTLDFAVKVAQKIESIFKDERKIIFTNSGTETVEAALKLCFAKKKLKKPEEGIVICLDGAFHGRTNGSLPLMDPKKKVRTEYFPMPYEAARFSYPTKNVNTPDEILTAIEEKRLDLSKVIAVIIEPVQGEGGIYVPDIP
ncbi:MAG: aminotransferase class III-fold pyridoxal phosphate-dependent enzyme, partial [Patescibacteria group bacterium]